MKANKIETSLCGDLIMYKLTNSMLTFSSLSGIMITRITYCYYIRKFEHLAVFTNQLESALLKGLCSLNL